MSSDEFQVQNIYRYARKTYKKNRRTTLENDIGPSDNAEVDASPRSDARLDSIDDAACSCDLDPESEIASILHKKCPVITLAQQQLQRLLDDTDNLLCDNTRCCRSIYDFLCLCKEVFLNREKCRCVLLMLIGVAFFTGLIIGAASCGTCLRRFNSPIFTCIDNLFISYSYSNIEETFRSIA